MWIYLWGSKEMQEQLKDLDSVKKEKIRLKEDLEELKFKKRLEQEEIVHLQKINESRLKQQLEEEKVKMLKEKNEEMLTFQKTQIAELNKIQTEHVSTLALMHKQSVEKMEARFNTELGNLKELYTALMSRLPNITMAITKKM